MRAVTSPALVVSLLLLWALPLRADPPSDYPFVSYDEGLTRAAAENRRIFLYFGRYGCGWCDKTNKETFSDSGLRDLLSSHYVLVYADAESGHRLRLPGGERITEMELGARLNVFATPVFAWLESDGTLIFKAPGYKTVAEFREFDAYVRGGHYRTRSLADFLGQHQAP